MSARKRGTATTTRLRKIECMHCGYIARVSRKCLERGLPVCPCGTEMSCPELEDAVIADPDLFDRLSLHARNQVMRQLGYTDEIVRRHQGKRALKQHTCSHPSCSRFVAIDATECAAGHVQQWAIRTGAVMVHSDGTPMPF